jgi:diguanylate cyclase (GGDEF)-like protein
MVVRKEQNNDLHQDDLVYRINRYGWKIVLICSAMSLVVFGLHPTIVLQSALFFGAGLLAILVMLIGLWVYRPQPMSGWILMIVGQCFNVGGDLLFINMRYFGHQLELNWLESVLYLLGTLHFLAGLVVLFVTFRRLIQLNVLINGGIVAIGLSSLIWITQIAPHLSSLTSPVKWLDMVAFPAGELIIGAVASLFLMTPMGQTWSYRFLILTLLFYSTGLFFYNQMETEGFFSEAQLSGWLPVLINGAYASAYFFLGAAYLHPSIKNMATSTNSRNTVISKQNMFVLGLAFMIGPVAYWLELARGVVVNVSVVLVSMMVIFALIEARLVQLVRMLELQNRQLGHQQVQLQYQALHDSLTNLPNRASLDDYLVDIAGRNPASGALCALLMIDLDRFKLVNDTFGHNQGDIVLLQVADRLMKIKRKEDMVARWGGDEFVFVIENLHDPEDALAIAHRLFNEVRIGVGQGDHQVMVTLSIGGCLFRGGKDDIQDVMKRADIALYHAKSFRDEEKISFFPDDMEP